MPASREWASCAYASPVYPAVIKETPGMLRFQVIQTGPATLKIRLEGREGDEHKAVWQAVKQRLRPFLDHQGLSNAFIALAPEPPMRDPKSGKFRHVWVE